MIRLLTASAAVLGIFVLLPGAVPATALPAAWQAAPSAPAGDGHLLPAAAKKKKARRPHVYVYGPRRARAYDDGPGWYGPDNVGSLGQDGWGYGYNRFSGQRYQSCVEDLGYGRVRPCDAGRR